MLKKILPALASWIVLLIIAVRCDFEILVWISTAIFGVIIINELGKTIPDPVLHKLSFQFVFDYSLLTITKMRIQKSKFPVNGHIAPSTDTGASEAVQDVSYSSSDETVLTVEKDPDDPRKFKLNFVGLGTANITATADADLGEGVTTLTDTLEVKVEEDEATKLNIGLDL